MTAEQDELPRPSASPTRKRSLEDESSSDDENWGGRYKRQVVSSSHGSSDPSPRRRSSSPNPAKKNHVDGESIQSGDNASRDNQGTHLSDDTTATSHIQTHPQESVARSFSMRALITAKEAGVVIGKGGRNVADIRENSGARVQVSEQVPGAHERVVTITGPLDTVAKAFSLVAFKIVEELETAVELNSRHTAIRVLIPHSRMGSVIGRQGQKIKEIQDASGARVSASEQMLPDSTERTVTVQGVVDSIHIAAYHIGLVLQENPERSAGSIPYKPQGLRTHQHHHGPRQHNRRHSRRGHHDHPNEGFMGGAGPQGPQGPLPMGMQFLPAGAVQMQQIFVPNDMVGAIIGKAGRKINEIRQASGCQIKIAENEGSAERLVTITGTPDANQMALYLLYSRLEEEKARMDGL